MNKNPYKSFDNFVLRTSLFPINLYKEITNKRSISDEDFKNIYKNDIVKESIYLASPVLFEELKKWVEGNISDKKKSDRIKNSFLKYIARMSSRCTPFGLFAGCALGEFGNETNIVQNQVELNSRHTRFDMNYLVALARKLEENDFIKEKLLYFPNTTLYKAGKDYRYVEYQFQNGMRDYDIVSAESTIYLNQVLKMSKEGILLDDLIINLKKIFKEVNIEDVKLFVTDLVDSQVLISELEPSISGEEFIDQIINIIDKHDDEKSKGVLNIILELKQLLVQIDNELGNNLNVYENLISKLELLKTDFNKRFLIQTDLILKPKINILNKEIISDLRKGMCLLNKISLPNPNTSHFKKFEEKFSNIFGDEEDGVLLSTVLDTEMGIGYKQNQKSTGINPLIEDLKFKNARSLKVNDIKWSKINSIIHNKIIRALISKENIIKLTEKDFENLGELEENWTDLNDTIFSTLELVIIDGVEKVIFKGAAGPSGATLLGRFCNGDSKIYKHTQKIADFEKKANKDKIIAEIVHLPQSRSGNILMRPNFRDYEIPYLSNSLLDNDKQILISDLFLALNGKRELTLKSIKHNKEVVPYLTTAHNFSNDNSLPIYQFLGDFQTQNKRTFIGFNLGPFANEYDFIPRIEYKNLILSEAKWNLVKFDFKVMQEIKSNDDSLWLEAKLFRKQKTIPKFVLFVDGDNELLINFENLTSIRMFLDTIKNKEIVGLKEFLFADDCVVKNEQGENYTNQIIVSFFNNDKLNNERN